jgi:hypothetical protein
MTQDTTIGPGKRYAFPDLDMRLNADHPNASANWKDMVLRYSATGAEVPYRVYSINNHWDCCRHLAFTIPRLSVEHCHALVSFVPQLKDELGQVEIITGFDRDPQGGEMESTKELSWSNRVFIYTDYMPAAKTEVLAIFRSIGLKAVLTDDERWKNMLASRKPDVFLSHDFRDKEKLARPLAHAVSRLGLVAWYNEFSLKPGNRLSESIDKGLTECRHAVLLVTPNFLENKSCTSVEMSTLLTREVREKNLIIPVWSGVDDKAVAARSARLADLFAIREFAAIDDLAARVFSAVPRDRRA